MSEPIGAPPAPAPAPITAATVLANIKAFRAATPLPLRNDLDQMLKDLAALGKQDIDNEVLVIADKSLGKLIGDLAGKRVNAVINAAVDAGVDAIES